MHDIFRTNFPVNDMQSKIDYHSKVVFAGSCFSENISEKLTHYKFQVLSNPFGIIYNPVSLAVEFQLIMNKHTFTESDIFFEEGVYRSFYMHSRISHPDKETMLRLMNSTITEGYDFLKTATHLILTPGTARVYATKSNGKIVANNHKQPAQVLDKKQLHFKEVVEVLNSLVKQLKIFNPGINIIFTVSPVRHLKDGVVENMHSKATLITAVHEVMKNLSDTFYFPAYELMMDDLRDYRFYAEDMLHPNTVAVEYIFEKFKYACIAENAYALMKEIEELKTAMQHKPFFPESEQHKEFRKKYFLKAQNLQKQNPQLELAEELSFFKG